MNEIVKFEELGRASGPDQAIPDHSIKAVFFDVDGVLSDSLPKHLEFCRDKAEALKLPIEIPDVETFRRKVAGGAKANPMRAFLHTVGFPEDKLDALDDDYRAHFSAEYTSKKFRDVDQMLKDLHDRGIPIGLVTSNVRENVEPVLGAATRYFHQNLVFYGSRKADSLIAGAQRLGCVPGDCVFVGDVPTDATAAFDAGFRFLGAGYGWGILGNEPFKVVHSAAQIISRLKDAAVPPPFATNRSRLYTVDELWAGYDPDMSKNASLDAKIFKYFKTASKYSPTLEELRAQRCHDAGIEDAIDQFLGVDARSFPTGKCPVMILGSHSRYRRDIWFARVAHLTFELAQAGFFVATGGGPGLMEAGNLGAYMAKNYTKQDLNVALDILRQSQEPGPEDKRKQYEMPDYWQVAVRVAEKFPDGGDSLGVPTWFYGHEGANRFVTYIAKFLSNGLRESKMTSIGVFGTVFAPGGPGTSQEVFTDAAENNYHSFQWLSPMVFFNEPGEELSTRMLEIVRKQSSPDYISQDMFLHSADTQRIVRFLHDRYPQFRQRND